MCGDVDGPRDGHTKLHKSDTERHVSYDTVYMWIPKKGTDELIYRAEEDSQVEKKKKPLKF